MKVLAVDSGGRGHAIAWQFKNDPNVREVICAPGNAGIAREIRCEMRGQMKKINLNQVHAYQSKMIY